MSQSRLPTGQEFAASDQRVHLDALLFDLLPTAKRFRPGHRIRVTVQGADRDTHRKVIPNPPPRVAIYRDASRPSRIVLPLVPVR